ncbi:MULTISPECIES: phosphoglycolate phosphatase [unclassified Shewanella]|uniref:phosphoglycolate phosphatase n=1 Tax=unclassified Shewanella TaxID=196818 RepID=UPI000C860078|nr:MULTISPECIES: phosphoglycolate phosphatase [unclassified Shewanella]MDO6620040.1 phosphoglycolate phosphatase [Shewanella sp. 6_MG-2023]MDO6679341.1 phosphoglycolate phosphatase [Shewanella sp. 4_MG-2023]MDO6777345.1 phosphoglycolate phosphatase [Shewanella sp. 3_MG-2023]PMG31009.1 phosphoglycolate phosphatase [Shewanella sp. 10N.286.52.C2]PMG50789.1 phosphoglycolate phosphatase [Shewanella sp. 10N.286.52.B9]
MTVFSNIKAIAFDLDGTLIDSVPDLAAATNATLTELSLPNAQEAQVRSWVGNGANMLMRRALMFAQPQVTDTQAIDAQLEQVMPRFMHHYGLHLEKHSSLYPNVLSTLKQIKAAGYNMAIVTNKPYKFTTPLLESFGISAFFDLVLGGDSLEKMKPDPLPLTHILQQWQLEPAQLLMVGDSKNDILAAKSAGLSSIGLTYGYNYGEDIALSSPTAVCEQFNEILALLNLSAEMNATSMEQ